MIKANNNGFTLVELAIVMVVIGLLIGGVLKGQEMIGNAKITATINQVKSYQGATQTFKDMYRFWPGDMPSPNLRLNNCTIANFCAHTDPSLVGDGWLLSEEERQAYWGQLNAANLITGIDPTKGLFPGGVYPESKLNTSMFVTSAQGNGDITVLPGAVIRHGHYFWYPEGAGQYAPSLTPSQAQRLDDKLDDGNPSAGSVLAWDDADCSVQVNGAWRYNESETEIFCSPYILGF